MSWLPWRLVSSSSVSSGTTGAITHNTTTTTTTTTTVLQLHGNASTPPVQHGGSVVIPVLQPPLIRVAGTASHPVAGVVFRGLHIGYTRNPCPSQFAPGADGQWSQAWNHATVAPDVLVYPYISMYTAICISICTTTFTTTCTTTCTTFYIYKPCQGCSRSPVIVHFNFLCPLRGPSLSRYLPSFLF
jgi:hypothetical protein